MELILIIVILVLLFRVVADIGAAVEVFGDRIGLFVENISSRLLRSLAIRSARTVLRFFVLPAIMTMG